MTIIHNECSFLNKRQIKKIEKFYSGKYVFESPIKNSNNNWVNQSFAIFYTDIPHPQGSNYFGIYLYTGPISKWKINPIPMICDGISATETLIDGLMIDDEVIYSRYRHDFREHNGVYIDGGRDYTRYGGKRIDEAIPVKLKVNKDKLEII